MRRVVKFEALDKSIHDSRKAANTRDFEIELTRYLEESTDLYWPSGTDADMVIKVLLRLYNIRRRRAKPKQAS